MEDVIHWITEHKEESAPNRKVSHSHPDPTANEAMEHLAKQKIPVRDIKSSTDIRDWNAGNIPVALIHPASAGHGLNIQQGGHILIWFGLTWSLELYQQTNARLWRQGQTDVVTIHHIITKDTVDEDVMAALEQKDTTQEKLISAVKAQLGR